jgi:hypothetical protein
MKKQLPKHYPVDSIDGMLHGIMTREQAIDMAVRNALKRHEIYFNDDYVDLTSLQTIRKEFQKVIHAQS